MNSLIVLSKIGLGFVNWVFGVLLSWAAAFIIGQLDDHPDWQSAWIILMVGALAGFTISFLERYGAGLKYAEQLATFALPSIIGVVEILEKSEVVTLRVFFFSVWVFTLVCAMYYGDFAARRLE